MDPSIRTGTGIPNFPSYVSGHSTFSSAAATVLSYLFPDGQTYFETQATSYLDYTKQSTIESISMPGLHWDRMWEDLPWRLLKVTEPIDCT